MSPLFDGRYIYHKVPSFSWEKLKYGPMDKCGVSLYTSEALTLDSCEKHVELASLHTQELFGAHELLNSLARYNSTIKDPSKIWIYILLSWLFESKHNYIDPF